MNADTKTKLPEPPALPATVQELLAAKKTPVQPKLNDHIDDLHLRLWPDPKYRDLHEAVHNSQAVNGALDIDDTMAAMRIHELAIKNGDAYVQGQNLATIRKSMKVVCKRYGIGRKERRRMVG